MTQSKLNLLKQDVTKMLDTLLTATVEADVKDAFSVVTVQVRLLRYSEPVSGLCDVAERISSDMPSNTPLFSPKEIIQRLEEFSVDKGLIRLGGVGHYWFTPMMRHAPFDPKKPKSRDGLENQTVNSKVSVERGLKLRIELLNRVMALL